jgi:Protein of unknown function (DUF1573)
MRVLFRSQSMGGRHKGTKTPSFSRIFVPLRRRQSAVAYGPTCKTTICMLLWASLAWAACGRLEPPSLPIAKPKVDSLPPPLAHIAFDTNTFVFEDVQPEERIQHAFHFTNRGPGKLKIQDVKGSGGPCYWQNYPQDSIAVGARDSVVVECILHQPGIYFKSATVTANTEPRRQVLTVKAHVVE